MERELFYSASASVIRAQTNVGSEGYGTVSSVNVEVGQVISKGAILYRYYNSALDEKIFEIAEGRVKLTQENTNISLNEFNKNIDFTVRSKTSGVVQKLNLALGEYITRDTIPFVLQSLEPTVSAEIKVPPHLIEQVYPGLAATVILPTGIKYDGVINTVYPNYSLLNNTLKVDVSLNISPSDPTQENILDGTPVIVVVESKDIFATEVRRVTQSINIPVLKEFLTYEPNQ